MVAGNAALKPAAIDAWQTYNFEVEDLHTYVAGGVRVHNESGLLGKAGNWLNEALDKFLSGGTGSNGDGSFRDALTDLVTSPLHAAGHLATFGSASPLSPERRSALRRTADAALRAAEQDLVHLVQARIGPDQFAYIAVARRKPRQAGASLSVRLLEAA